MRPHDRAILRLMPHQARSGLRPARRGVSCRRPGARRAPPVRGGRRPPRSKPLPCWCRDRLESRIRAARRRSRDVWRLADPLAPSPSFRHPSRIDWPRHLRKQLQRSMLPASIRPTNPRPAHRAARTEAGRRAAEIRAGRRRSSIADICRRRANVAKSAAQVGPSGLGFVESTTQALRWPLASGNAPRSVQCLVAHDQSPLGQDSNPTDDKLPA
jgi:hypothetical protein